MIIDLLATIFGEVPVPRPASGAVPSRRIEWLFGDVEAPSIMRLYDDPTIDTPVGLSLLAMPRASRADAAPGIGAQGQKPTTKLAAIEDDPSGDAGDLPAVGARGHRLLESLRADLWCRAFREPRSCP
jgi:hypothetical protein